MIPESPRLLLINGKTKEANKVFEKIAKSNGKKLNIDLDEKFYTSSTSLEINDDLSMKEILIKSIPNKVIFKIE